MTEQPNIKVLVGYHRPSALLEGDIYVPIHLGRAVANESSKDGALSGAEYRWMLDRMIGDDTGDNISAQNRMLCELTGIYWAWKNYDRLGDPDYIGFMHHRRHLCFDLDNKETPDRYGLLYSEKLDEAYIKKYCLNSENVTSIVSRYDVVVAEKCDLEKLGTNNCYNHYIHSNPSLHVADYDRALKILIAKYPSYQDCVAEYNASHFAYFTNIFIMREKLFREYAEWLFPIVFEAQKYIDIAHYNISEARANAYISEWLFGIWYTHLKKKRDINSLELKRTLVRDTSIHIQQRIFPAFKTNNIALCFGADSRYVPYLAVTLRSIIENADPSNNYDICILHESIPPSLQHLILGMRKENVSIRFVCVDGYINQSRDEIFYTCDHFTRAVYHRFYIPEIFEAYEKVLYLDCDLAANRDVADLYKTTLGENYLVGAVRDCEIIRWTNKDKNWGLSYFINFLNIKNIFDYFQSGVILFNVEQCRKENITEKLVSTLEHIKEPNFPDQDILNIVCEGRVLFLDLRWNVEYHIPIWSADWMQTMSVGVLDDYVASRETPWIVHFSGAKKPWHDPSFELSEYFWKYARHTPFYEEILHANIKDATVKDNALKHQIATMQDAAIQQIRGDVDSALKQQVASMQGAVSQQVRGDMDSALKQQVATMQEAVTQQIRSDMDSALKQQVATMQEAVTQQIRSDMDNALKLRVAAMQDAVTQQIRSEMDSALKQQVATMQEAVTQQIRSDMDNALKLRVAAMQDAVTQQIRSEMDGALKQQVATMQDAVTQQIRSDMDNALKLRVAAMQEVVTRTVRSDMDLISKRQVGMIREGLMLPEYRRKFKRIRLKILFACGAKRQRYARRKQELKQRIKAAEELVGSN